jgi:ABC-type sugar transport system permease subunit
LKTLALLLIPWVSPVLTAANIFKGLFNEIGPVNQIFHLIGLGPFPWLADPSYAFPATIVANGVPGGIRRNLGVAA